MKKALLKKRSPQLVTAAKKHEDNTPHDTDSSIVTPGDVGDPGDLLSSLSSYIRRFLVCDDHQLTILALWCLYTWCYDSFLTASYLDVHSPAPSPARLAASTFSSSFAAGPI